MHGIACGRLLLDTSKCGMMGGVSHVLWYGSKDVWSGCVSRTAGYRYITVTARYWHSGVLHVHVDARDRHLDRLRLRSYQALVSCRASYRAGSWLLTWLRRW